MTASWRPLSVAALKTEFAAQLATARAEAHRMVDDVFDQRARDQAIELARVEKRLRAEQAREH